jgi:hypothetical protein
MGSLIRGLRHAFGVFSAYPVPCSGFIPVGSPLALRAESLRVTLGEKDFRAPWPFTPLPGQPFLALPDLQVQQFAGEDGLEVFVQEKDGAWRLASVQKWPKPGKS